MIAIMVVKIAVPSITADLGMFLFGRAIVRAAASETVGTMITKMIVLINNCIVIILSV